MILLTPSLTEPLSLGLRNSLDDLSSAGANGEFELLNDHDTAFHGGDRSERDSQSTNGRAKFKEDSYRFEEGLSITYAHRPERRYNFPGSRQNEIEH